MLQSRNWRESNRYVLRGMGHQPLPVNRSSPKQLQPVEYEGGCRRCTLRVHVETTKGMHAEIKYSNHAFGDYRVIVPQCPNAPKTQLIVLPEDFDIPF